MTDQQLWQRESSTYKQCPECAEQVQVAARVCRFCGYRFDAAPVGAPPPEPVAALDRKSPAAAGWLGFLISGLGHLYVGEIARAALVFASLVAIVVGSEIGSRAIYALAIAVWIFGIVDARRGAEHRNAGGRPRSPAGGVWAIVALGAVARMIGFATAPTRGRSDAAAVADQIKPELERQLQEQATDATVTVTDVTCVGGSSSGGTCLADVSDSLGNEQHVSISYTVDASTGEMIWHTD